jgi:hypothetical protein
MRIVISRLLARSSRRRDVVHRGKAATKSSEREMATEGGFWRPSVIVAPSERCTTSPLRTLLAENRQKPSSWVRIVGMWYKAKIPHRFRHPVISRPLLISRSLRPARSAFCYRASMSSTGCRFKRSSRAFISAPRGICRSARQAPGPRDRPRRPWRARSP